MSTDERDLTFARAVDAEEAKAKLNECNFDGIATAAPKNSFWNGSNWFKSGEASVGAVLAGCDAAPRGAELPTTPSTHPGAKPASVLAFRIVALRLARSGCAWHRIACRRRRPLTPPPPLCRRGALAEQDVRQRVAE